MPVQDKFLQYVAFDTTSDPKSETIPSTAKQKVLGAFLAKQLKTIGIMDAFMDQFGYVYGSLPANTAAVTIGFIAHMDTSDAVSGAHIQPRIIENYDGQDIVLNPEVVTTVERFPQLPEYTGKTLIVTDGTTLLGADDKAGVAIIMEAMEYLVKHPEVKHGKICIAFTPDEEIGQGTIKFDLNRFDCAFAYTVDGGKPNEIEYENFNAASALVTVKGLSTHPGSAKDKMINALNVAMEFHQLLPAQQRPEHTDGYEGFNHLMEFSGDVESAKMLYIIRNHQDKLFQAQKKQFTEIAAFLNQRYPADTVAVTLKDSYKNMKQVFSDKMYIVELAEKAIAELGMEPKCVAIRGGTDGAELTYKGIPCPNLGTGGQNYHGRYEFCCVEDMQAGVKIVLKIAGLAVDLPC